MLLGEASVCHGPQRPLEDRDPIVVAPSVPAGTGALPFDTVGAGRGVPPNRYEYAPQGKWIGGDTTVWASLAAFPGSDSIELRVMGRDTSTDRLREIPIQLAACPVELRLYTEGRRAGSPAWRSDAAPRELSCAAVKPSPFGKEVVVEWPVAAILGDSLPPRRYYFGYTVRLADGRALTYASGDAYLDAARRPATRDRSTLQFASTSEVAGRYPRQLRAWTTITNRGPRLVRLEHGACALNIRLWRNAARQGPPVWRSEYRQPPQRRGEQPTMHACTMQLILRQLPPGDSLPFRLEVPLTEVLADSLPEGRYWVGVELQLLNDSLRPPDWQTRYDFSAGDVTLRREPDPPPTMRMQGPLRMEAATRLVRGPTREADSVHIFVLVTNTAADSSEVVVVRGNPLSVYAFRSAAERDSLPIPTPAYTIHGATQFALHRFRLRPGQKWLFENAISARDLRASVGPGRYHFLAWLMSESSTLLAAGSVELDR
jgi:hypothetical protein